MNDEIVQNCAVSGDCEIEKLDALIANATAATDSGDYRCAVDGFRQVVLHAQRYFGQSPDLTEFENTIADIEGLLD